MVLYFGIVLLTTGLAIIYEKVNINQKKYVFTLLVVVPTLFSGLRKVGTDYFGYLERYESISNGITLDEYGQEMKSLFYWFMKINDLFIGDFQILVCIVSFLTIFFAFYIICQYDGRISIPFAVFSFMTFFYFLSFNIFRQILSAEMFFLAIFLYYEKEKKRKALIYIIISVMLHSATIIYAFLLFLMPYIRKFKRSKQILCCISLLGGIFILPVFSNILIKLINFFPHYAYYFVNFSYQGLGFGVIRTIILVWSVCFLINSRQENDAIFVYSSLAVIGSILFWSSYVSTTFIYRIGYTGMITLPILHGYFMKNSIGIKFIGIKLKIRMHSNICNRFFVFVLPIVLLFFVWYDYYILNTGNILPYKTVFK